MRRQDTTRRSCFRLSQSDDGGREMRVGSKKMLDLEVRRKGRVVARLRAEADPRDPRDLERLLKDAVHRDGGAPSDIGDYEMDIREADERPVITTFVATSS
jgi:hypothetical protein